jgi:hypothetical protein
LVTASPETANLSRKALDSRRHYCHAARIEKTYRLDRIVEIRTADG